MIHSAASRPRPLRLVNFRMSRNPSSEAPGGATLALRSRVAQAIERSGAQAAPGATRNHQGVAVLAERASEHGEDAACAE